MKFRGLHEHATLSFSSSLGVSPLRGGPAGRRARRDVPAPGGVARDLVSSLEPISYRALKRYARILGTS